MSYDYKNAQWQRDINSFEMWKGWLIRLEGREGDFYIGHREMMRKRLRDIQRSWPQFIKVDEIP